MARLGVARDVDSPTRVGCSRCGETGADPFKSVQDEGAPGCAPCCSGQAGRAGNRSGVRGLACPLLPERGRELPGRGFAPVSSQRHPPTGARKALGSPREGPVVAVLGRWLV